MMPIVGIGMDITQVSRIADSLANYGERFEKRVFHPLELEQANRRAKNVEFLAACFAVKEATLKCLGDFPGKGIAWTDIYVTHESTGKPNVNLAGKAKELADSKGVTVIHVTITHDAGLALAQVVMEK